MNGFVIMVGVENMLGVRQWGCQPNMIPFFGKIPLVATPAYIREFALMVGIS